jgi:hypothetical protein
VRASSSSRCLRDASQAESRYGLSVEWPFYDGRELAEAVRSGDVKIEGDESAVARFLTLFPLPEPASPVAGA